jgi:hypothetical protein
MKLFLPLGEGCRRWHWFHDLSSMYDVEDGFNKDVGS